MRIEVRTGHHLAVRRRGDGGVPLLLIHGFPCTSRIWSHNLVPLAEAGAVGPFWVKGAGHFMPWERPETVNRAIRAFCGDLLVG